MSDDFLHQIRVEPPASLRAGLKSKLDQERRPPEPGRRWLSFRSVTLGVLIGAGSIAIALTVSGNLPGLARLNLDAWHLAPRGRPASDDSNQSDGSKPTSNSAAPSNAADLPLAPQTANGVAAGPSATQKSVSPPFLKMAGPAAPSVAGSAISRRVASEVIDTSSAFELLCNAAAVRAEGGVDLVGTDRRILRSELDACKRAGVNHIGEIKVGYEAVALVRSKLYGAPALSTRDVFLALARQVPDPEHPGALVKNPNSYWSQVNAVLPEDSIEVTGPRLSSVTGIAFIELLLEPGCKTYPWIAALQVSDERRYNSICKSVRKDGAYIESGGGVDPNLVWHLEANQGAMGLIGFQTLNGVYSGGSVTPSSIDGVEPTKTTVVAGSYPASRPIYVYLNKTRYESITQMKDFVRDYIFHFGEGPDTTSLIPLEMRERDTLARSISKLPDLTIP